VDKFGKNQKPLFFGEDNRRMYGVLHHPSGSGPGGKKRGIIFCSPFAEEFTRTWGQMAFWARELSGLGYFVFRFQYHNTGDSGGDLSQLTLTSMVSDTQEAIKLLEKTTSVEEVGLFGFRLGATIAAAAATKNIAFSSNSKASFLILWCPITNTKNYIESFLRLRITKELVHQKKGKVQFTRADMIKILESGGEVDVMGYPISSELYKEMVYASPWSSIVRLPDKALVLCKNGEEAQLGNLIQKYNTSNDVKFKVLREKVFWERLANEIDYFPTNFSKATMTWLKAIHSGDCNDVNINIGANANQGTKNLDKSIETVYREEKYTEKIVNFTNDAGLMLHGIVHAPDPIPEFKQKKIGIVILLGSVRTLTTKSGSHRLFTKAARALCQQGFHVLRFDYRESGDSQGEIYSPINMSTKIYDTLAAIKYLKNSLGLEKIILWGHCGGVVMATHCAAMLSKDDNSAEHVDALILSSPLFNFNKYRGRRLKIKNIIRVLTFQTDIRDHIKLIPQEIKNYFFPSEEDKQMRSNYFKKFPETFGLYDGPVLFTLGEKDHVVEGFYEEVEKNKQWRFLERKHTPKVCLIEGGDHSYASAEQEKTLISEILKWLGEIFNCG